MLHVSGHVAHTHSTPRGLSSFVATVKKAARKYLLLFFLDEYFVYFTVQFYTGRGVGGGNMFLHSLREKKLLPENKETGIIGGFPLPTVRFALA